MIGKIGGHSLGNSLSGVGNGETARNLTEAYEVGIGRLNAIHGDSSDFIMDPIAGVEQHWAGGLNSEGAARLQKCLEKYVKKNVDGWCVSDRVAMAMEGKMSSLLTALQQFRDDLKAHKRFFDQKTSAIIDQLDLVIQCVESRRFIESREWMNGWMHNIDYLHAMQTGLEEWRATKPSELPPTRCATISDAESAPILDMSRLDIWLPTTEND
ncbi:MAG TPA: hypothetical protein VEC06_14685 [Paucimonas sp.]|nr:hypothetical protein [Paucimonas sp.]